MKLIYYESIFDLFEEEVSKFGTVETGGVLLGYRSENSIIVTKAVGAGPNAIHENFYFQADNNYIEMMIDMEYANSQGEISYLGEWHTHPQIYPSPSQVDLTSLEEITDSSGTINLLLILGAIGFSGDKFLKQSTSVLKSPNESKFIEIKPEIRY